MIMLLSEEVSLSAAVSNNSNVHPPRASGSLNKSVFVVPLALSTKDTDVSSSSS